MTFVYIVGVMVVLGVLCWVIGELREKNQPLWRATYQRPSFFSVACGWPRMGTIRRSVLWLSCSPLRSFTRW